MSVAKINKLVESSFDKEFVELWMAVTFQKKLKKILKTKREKLENEESNVKKYTPYILFCMSERPKIKTEFENYSAKEITAKLGERWNKLKIEDPEFLEEKYGYVKKI